LKRKFKVVVARALHVILNMCTACMCVYQSWNVSQTCSHYFYDLLWLCNAVVTHLCLTAVMYKNLQNYGI